jgi:hypothetical protein
VRRFAWIVLINLSCAETGSAHLETPRPQTGPTPEDPLRTCWAEARSNPSNLAEFGFADAQLRWFADQQFLAVRLRFRNKSSAPIWVNKRATSDGPDLLRELSVRIDAPLGALRRGEAEGDRGVATAGDYVLVHQGETVEMVTKIRFLDYPLPAGRYRLAICFWDRNPAPPNAPQGAKLLEHALAADPVELIREAGPNN